MRIIAIAVFLLTAVPAFGAGDLTVMGKIGAGTTTPRATLEVNGSAIIPYTVSTAYVDLSKGLTPSVTAGTLLSGGPCFRGDSSRWQIQDFPASMVVDLGPLPNSFPVKYLAFGTYSKESAEHSPSDYILEQSADGSTWLSFATVTANTAKHMVHQVDADLGRYLRLTVVSPQPGQAETDIAGFQVLSDMHGESARTHPWGVTGDDAFLAVTGNVGIGTSDPLGYKLYVSGTSYSTGGWQSSDIRYKENLQKISEPLRKILSLKGVSYNWKTDRYKDKGFPGGRHYGVIAQDIESVLPEVVHNGQDGMKSVAYTEIIPVLIEAIKEQQQEIEQLKKELGTRRD